MLPLVDNGISAVMRQPLAARSPERLPEHVQPLHPSGPAGSLNTDICQWCLNPFSFRMKNSGKPRDSIQYEPLRAALKITDSTYDPVICDACFEHVTQSQIHNLLPGWSNHQPPNMLLK